MKALLLKVLLMKLQHLLHLLLVLGLRWKSKNNLNLLLLNLLLVLGLWWKSSLMILK